MNKRMQRKKKRIFSSVLTFLLCFSMLVEPVMATESGTTPTPAPTVGDILNDAGDFEDINYEISSDTVWRWHKNKDDIYEGNASVGDNGNDGSPAGGKYLNITGNGTNEPVIKYMNYPAIVEGNTTYILDMYIRRNSEHYPYIVLYDRVYESDVNNKIVALYTDPVEKSTDTNNKIVRITTQPNTNGWQQVTYEFTTQENASEFQLRVHGNGKNVSFDIDGISVVKKYKASVNNTEYTSLEDAIAVAENGDIVKLLDDIAYENDLTICDGITLDLNGNTLTTWYMFSSNGNVVDNSTGKTGVLKVDSTKCVFSTTNEHMPIYNGTGYVFADITEQETHSTVQEDDSTVFNLIFRPFFGSEATIQNALSTADNGIDDQFSVILRLTWNGGTQDLVYRDDIVQAVYSESKAFYINASGVTEFEGLTITPMVVSDGLGVAWSGTSFTNFKVAE